MAVLSIIESNLANNTSLSKEDIAKHRKNANQYLMRAFKINSRNSFVALEMGKRFFDKEQYPKALVMVETCLRNTDIPLLQADATFLKGLIHQAQCQFDEALVIFEEASKMNPKSLLIDYGLGQLYIYKGETEKAVNHLEKILAKQPDNYEATKKLASLYSKSPDTRPKSFSYFEKLKRLMRVFRQEQAGPGVELSEQEYLSDYEVLIEWAALLEETDIGQATKCNVFFVLILRECGLSLNPRFKKRL